jgi:hypothetical protein
LLYGSGNTIIVARDARIIITAAEMKYVRQTSRYTSKDYKTNTEISKERNIIPVVDKIQAYRKNCLQYRAFHNVLRNYKIYYRETIGNVFTKPVQIEGTTQSSP